MVGCTEPFLIDFFNEFHEDGTCYVYENSLLRFGPDIFEYDWSLEADDTEIVMTSIDTGSETWKIVEFSPDKLIIEPLASKEERPKMVFVRGKKPKIKRE